METEVTTQITDAIQVPILVIPRRHGMEPSDGRAHGPSQPIAADDCKITAQPDDGSAERAHDASRRPTNVDLGTQTIAPSQTSAGVQATCFEAIENTTQTMSRKCVDRGCQKRRSRPSQCDDSNIVPFAMQAIGTI